MRKSLRKYDQTTTTRDDWNSSDARHERGVRNGFSTVSGDVDAKELGETIP